MVFYRLRPDELLLSFLIEFYRETSLTVCCRVTFPLLVLFTDCCRVTVFDGDFDSPLFGLALFPTVSISLFVAASLTVSTAAAPDSMDSSSAFAFACVDS